MSDPAGLVEAAFLTVPEQALRANPTPPASPDASRVRRLRVRAAGLQTLGPPMFGLPVPGPSVLELSTCIAWDGNPAGQTAVVLPTSHEPFDRDE
jgi:hypothetical protein